MGVARGIALVGVVAAVALDAGGAPATATELAPAAKQSRLVSFNSCREYLDYVKPRAVDSVHAFGFGGLAPVLPSVLGPIIPLAPLASATVQAPAAQQGVDYSATNVQEEGVDEPDVVKTDGSTLFVVANGKLSSVDVRERKPRLLDAMRLADPDSDLLLHRNRLLILASSGYQPSPSAGRTTYVPPYGNGQSTLVEVDVSDPRQLTVVRTLRLDGYVIGARLVAGTIRLVAAAQIPEPLPFERPTASTVEAYTAAAERNRMIFAESGASDWLPSYRIKQRGGRPTAERPLVQCRHVRRPSSYAGLGMLTVLTIDLAKGLEPVSSTSLMTDTGTVYASPESLYVATEAWDSRFDPNGGQQSPPTVSTALHKFDISSPERAVYRGSGSVNGFLLSQWSLSEHRGVLRVVSTDQPSWVREPDEERESFLTTLRQQGGALVQAGRVGGLGKGEDVYAVRFVGAVGYVVTFEQVDPLYTLDLSDPERPRVLGELKIPGYSAYLHPIGEDLLLGVGQDATDEGVTLGLQLSIFDVSDLRRPVRLHRRSLGYGASVAEWDHHGFLFWPRTGLVVIPADGGAVAFRVGGARGIDPVGEVQHEARDDEVYDIERSLVMRESVLTVSAGGVKANAMATWAEEGWAALPRPEPEPEQ